MLLLDTHIFYWFLRDDPRLPREMRDAIETSRDVFVSVVTFWEMAIKSSLGKLVLPAPIEEMMRVCLDMEFTILPIGSSHLSKLLELPWIHRDPFDRLIVAQAKSEGLTLLTVDENIKKYGVS